MTTNSGLASAFVNKDGVKQAGRYQFPSRCRAARPSDDAIEMGTISVTWVVADSDTAQKALVFFPTALTDGIELSDDPLPALRTSAYAPSFARRQQQ
jgi:hypothetical protein